MIPNSSSPEFITLSVNPSNAVWPEDRKTGSPYNPRPEGRGYSINLFSGHLWPELKENSNIISPAIYGRERMPRTNFGALAAIINSNLT